MIQSPETQAKISLLREKSLNGTITLEEVKEAISILRADRHGAASTPKAKSRTAKPATVNVNDLFSELDNL